MCLVKFQTIFINILAIIVLSGFFFVPNISFAETCKIEDWNFSKHSPGTIKIHGTTTCESGKLMIRVYDKDDNYLGNNFTYFEGHIFVVYIQDVGKVPSSIQIKYDIKPR